MGEIEQLNIKENLEHVKFLGNLVENQAKEIEELKNENKKFDLLKNEIEELKKINEKQNEEIQLLQLLKNDIAALSERLSLNETNSKLSLERVKSLETTTISVKEKLNHVDQIASRVSLQSADFNDADLTGQDMSGQNLSGASYK